MLVSYIFSDKTGTLTNNCMRFRKLSVAGTAWLHDPDIQKEALDEAASQLRISKKGRNQSGESDFLPQILLEANQANRLSPLNHLLDEAVPSHLAGNRQQGLTARIRSQTLLN